MSRRGPKGRKEGDPIDDYVVEEHASHVLATFKTQHEAIEWSKKQGHAPALVEIARYKLERHKPLRWRNTRRWHGP